LSQWFVQTTSLLVQPVLHLVVLVMLGFLVFAYHKTIFEGI
jgi:hypothetical protein